MRLKKRLSDIGIELPGVVEPVGGYVPAVVGRDTIMVSGQLPMKDGKLMAVGRVGAEVTLEEAQAAARRCMVNALAAAEWAIKPGEMDRRFAGILRVGVFVASADGFTDQHKVANGASGLLRELFVGEHGPHARSAVGVSRLPLDAAVEVELTVAITPSSDGPEPD